MNSLDRKLELFAANEPDPAAVQEAQRKLEARIARLTGETKDSSA